MSSPAAAPSRHVLRAAFWVPLALILIQVSFTRLIAYKLFYHYVFLAISLTLLGLSAAAVYVTIRPRPERATEDRLRSWLLAFAVSLPLVFLLMNAPFLLDPSQASISKLRGRDGLLYLVWVSPGLVWLNVCGGVVLALIFSRYPAAMGRAYARDLFGTGCGALLAVGLMKLATPPRAFLAALLPILLAWYPLFAPLPARDRRRRLGTLGAVLALLLAGGLAFGPERLRSFDGGAGTLKRIHKYEWDHLFRTDHVGGFYVLDADAATPVRTWRPGAQPPFDPAYLLAKPAPRVAVIGSGGGAQVEEARRQEAASILAIDINQSIVRWVQGQDVRLNNGLFTDPRVTLVQGEGRHCLRSAGGGFDLVTMHAVDSYSSTSSGAYALSENFLYTQEAFQDYYRALAPGGVMSVVRWLFNPPRENLRLFATALAALRAEGVAEPTRHLAVFSMATDYANLPVQTWGLLLFSRRPLGPADLARLRAHAQQRRWALLYAPGHTGPPNAFADYARADDPAAFARAYPYQVTPATDAQPYFFQLYRPFEKASYKGRELAPGGVGMADVYQASSLTLPLTIVATTFLSVILVLLPLWLRDRSEGVSAGLPLRRALHFACLGVGFMAFEVPLIQVLSLYLGHPTYGFVVVLVSLLWFAAVGSALAARRPPALGRVELVAAAALLLVTLAVFPLVHGTIDWPAPARFGISLALIGLCGVPLGFPLALAMQSLEGQEQSARAAAWGWAINGSASVVGSCLVMAIMIFAGSHAALATGVACYLVAAWAIRPRPA